VRTASDPSGFIRTIEEAIWGPALGGDPSRVSWTVALTSLKAVIAGAVGGIHASAAAALVVAGSAPTLIAARVG
jgi:hypothetical protein